MIPIFQTSELDGGKNQLRAPATLILQIEFPVTLIDEDN